MEKEEELEEYKENSDWIWRENKCRSKIIKKVRYGRKKRLQKKRVTREVYSKDALWMKW